MLLATGIYCWETIERQSQRYGYIFLGASTFENDYTLTPTFNDEARKFLNKKVKLTAKVTENRQSGHSGDLYIDYLPQMPQVGDEIVLGVGFLDFTPNTVYDDITNIGLIPADTTIDKPHIRKTYWIDPVNHYKLHDQTVELHVELTDEPAHAVPQIVPVRQAGKPICNGDGTFQIVHPPEDLLNKKIKPKVGNLGNGTFSMSAPIEKGEQVDFID